MIKATTVAGYDMDTSRVDNLLTAPEGMTLAAYEEMKAIIFAEPCLALDGFHLVDVEAEALDDLQLELFLEED